MNILDQSILQYLNGFAQRSAIIDNSLSCMQNNDLFKGGVIIPALWGLWFKKDEQVREYIITTVLASLGALIVARGLAIFLPFRVRPIYNPHLHLLSPFGAEPQQLETWSAFPSDHAVFFFAVATGIAMVSRKVGILLILYALLGICLPRIYFGYHHPTDILVGAFIGLAATTVACMDKVRTKLSSPFLKLERQHPAIFYGGSFLITFQMVVLFDNLRDLGRRLKDVCSNL